MNMNEIKKVRDSNIEALRIILMLIIVAHHYIVNSGVIDSVNQFVLRNGGGVLLFSPDLWLGR